MGERLEKLFTLTDIKNAFEAPVTIEAGGLIRDTVSGRVIARMYLKNGSDKPLDSVLVGFYPKDETGRPISGMRDYRYDAGGVAKDEIFGDDVGILFDNNDTAQFSYEIQEVSFEDGDFWDKEAPEPLIVPAEKEGAAEGAASELWHKGEKSPEVPDVWKDRTCEEVEVPDLWKDQVPGANAEPEEQAGAAEPEPEAPSQLEHQEIPQLAEETDSTIESAKKKVINLGGPSDEEGEVIELGGPTEVEETETPVETEEPEVAEEPEVPEAPVETEEPEVAEEPAAAVEPEETEAPAAAIEPEIPAEPEEPEAPVGPEEPLGTVRLADMATGFSSDIKGDIDIASIPEEYMPNAEEPKEEVQEAGLPEEQGQPEEPSEAPSDENQSEPAETASENGEKVSAESDLAAGESHDLGPSVSADEQAGSQNVDLMAGLGDKEKASGAEEKAAGDLPDLPSSALDAKPQGEASEEAAPSEGDTSGQVTSPEEAENAPEEKSGEAEPKVDPVMADPEKVFAAEPEAAVQVPSIIDDKKQKALTGEDHSGRNLLNIVIFGGIAFVILLVIMMNM